MASSICVIKARVHFFYLANSLASQAAIVEGLLGMSFFLLL